MIRFDITTTNNKLLELTAKQQANKLSIKATQNPVINFIQVCSLIRSCGGCLQVRCKLQARNVRNLNDTPSE